MVNYISKQYNNICIICYQKLADFIIALINYKNCEIENNKNFQYLRCYAQ